MREEVDVVCVVEFAEDLRQPADGPRHWCEHVRAQHVEGLHDRCRHPDDHIVERVESCRRATHHEDGSLVARASELEEGCPVVALRVGVHALRVDQLPTWVEELCGIPDGRLRLIGNGGEEAKVAEANLPMSGPEVEPGRASQACGIPLLHIGHSVVGAVVTKHRVVILCCRGSGHGERCGCHDEDKGAEQNGCDYFHDLVAVQTVVGLARKPTLVREDKQHRLDGLLLSGQFEG
mmetsp:Transcript_75274/g.232356  ORF Transcript_75274/g.232356 Transcript_75274/m.232356 type:complete len:235 (-) Transcript_75274:76-780(-)